MKLFTFLHYTQTESDANQHKELQTIIFFPKEIHWKLQSTADEPQLKPIVKM